MSQIIETIDVDVPVRTAYDQWTQFESFPQFMEGVESVRQVDDSHLHWIATVAGRRQEWDAEISEQVPDQRITWHSTTGDQNAGAVAFERVGEERTRITLTMGIEPSNTVEKVGTAIGIPSAQVKGDLERFKQFIESRGRATGAWRGEVSHGSVTRTDAPNTTPDRELAGTGTMGMTGTGSDLGDRDVNLSGGTASSDPHATGRGSTVYDTGAGTASTGDTGAGLPNREDLGTGHRLEDRDL